MPVKLIFFKHPITGNGTAKFCPLVETGCAKCFLPKEPHGCKGESDKRIAFRLWEKEGRFHMGGI